MRVGQQKPQPFVGVALRDMTSVVLGWRAWWCTVRSFVRPALCARLVFVLCAFFRFGGVGEMLNGLLNLQVALAADAWVCTTASNW